MKKTSVYCLEMYLTFEFEIVILHCHVSFRESNCFFFSLSLFGALECIKWMYHCIMYQVSVVLLENL